MFEHNIYKFDPDEINYGQFGHQKLLDFCESINKNIINFIDDCFLLNKIKINIDYFKDFGIKYPTIAIAGLNPHSGEQGQLGREEQDWLIPWLLQAQQDYPQAKLIGPVPPDTLWVSPGQAWFNQQTTSVADGYLALYHDQGLIPVKLLAFDQAINTTIGLPFIRTSPDHGTAFDIAGQGLARSDSFRAAIQLAAELGQQRLGDNGTIER